MDKRTSLKNRVFMSWTAMTLTLCTAIAAFANPACAADVAQTPLILGQTVAPNIYFVLDDSGSMHMEFMPANPITTEPMGVKYPGMYNYPATPDDIYAEGDSGNKYPSVAYTTFDNDAVNAYMRYSGTNKIYYNPAVTYDPWVKADGSSMLAADPAAAYWNPSKLAQGDTPDTYDLTTKTTDVDAIWVLQGSNSQEPIDVDCDKANDDDSCEAYTQSFWPMVYWIYQGPESALIDDSDDSEWDITNYVKVELRGPKGAENAVAITTPQDNDPDTPVDPSHIKTGKTMADVWALTGYPANLERSYDDAVQNFANWFQYYRSRNLFAKGGIGRAFANQGKGVRVGFGAINPLDSGANMELKVTKFDTAGRQQFYETVYAFDNDRNNTPLRTALDELGERIHTKDYMWYDTPGVAGSGMAACRQSFVVFTTDGYWNGGAPDGIGDEDGDGHSDTLADVAYYYWKNDLRDDLTDKQHMITFTVGLGVFGTLDEAQRQDAMSDPTSFSWPDPSDGDKEKIDDLFHAAVNGHGKYFSASNPEEFTNALAQSLEAIDELTGSSASASTNTGLAVPAETYIYKPVYNTGDWTGNLVAYQFDKADLSLDKTINAKDRLEQQNWDKRTIITGKVIKNASNSREFKQGVGFIWSEISQYQQNFLDKGDTLGQKRLKYLRGNTTWDGATLLDGGTPGDTSDDTIFRDRVAILGDIVHSTPVYISAPGALLRMPGYATFRDDHANRRAVIYVGANDGMLHAFDAETLEEKLAYIPAGVYENLHKLTKKDYKHQYFVDGTPAVADAYFGSDSSWHTVLVGTTAAGGKSVFALDITNPDNFKEDKASAVVLWEINPKWDTNNDYDDLGYTFSRPSIVKMNNDQWVAIFGNGYDSTSGNAVLYIVDIEDGSLIKSFVVDDSGTDNGLSTPVAVDLNNDHVADRIYAGDLHGDLWAFDVSSDTVSSWKVAFTDAGKPAPLFDGDADHPITVRPAVVRNPEGGQVVLFGTGQFFETDDDQVDPNAEPIQSFYGIWDSSAIPTTGKVTRNNLVEQNITQITRGTAPDEVKLRLMTDNPVVYSSITLGWYIDFNVPKPVHNGERVVRDPLLRPNKLIFTTVIPSENPCAGGGTGWLMEVDPLTGGRLSFSAFDLNGNGSFGNGDFVDIEPGDGVTLVPVSGVQPTEGVPTRPAVIIDPESGNEFKFITGSKGNTAVVPNNKGSELIIGRLSWHQLE